MSVLDVTGRKLMHSIVSLWNDTSGVILPYVTIMLIAIVAISVLALDGARYMSLQTQLQAGADALALAGAAELDGLPDSETRAVNAINSLVVNSTSFGAATRDEVVASNIQFYSQLPPNDANPISEGILATEPMQARFVYVAVRPVTMSTILPASVFGGTSTVTTGAHAVAGFDQVVCDFTPVFVCNPFEADGMSYEEATRSLQLVASDPLRHRQLIRLRQNGAKTGQFAPGDYGFLSSTSLGTSNAALIDSVAQVHRNACFRRRGVDIRPGEVSAINEGVNVRFDIYTGSMVENRTEPSYRPAENVRKGFVGGGLGGDACSAAAATYWPIGTPPNQATGLPLDREWPYLNGQMGNGNWDFETYWQVNHGSNGRPPPTVGNELASNSNLPSRYAVYRYEIDQGYVDDLSPGGETGTPACYRGAGLTAVPDRRIINAAIINCRSLYLGEGSLNNVPVASFGRFFLTLPLMRAQTDIYVELLGLVTPGDGTLDYETVQLYR